MANGVIEVSGAPHFGLAGTIEANLYEYGGVAPTTIIRIDEDWAVDLKWTLTGPLRPLVCGKWCIHVHLESMGKGPELSLPDERGPEVLVDLNPCGNGEYDHKFIVPKGTITAAHCSRVYKVVATITFRNACDNKGPIAGFVELPMVQFYDPGP